MTSSQLLSLWVVLLIIYSASEMDVRTPQEYRPPEYATCLIDIDDADLEDSGHFLVKTLDPDDPIDLRVYLYCRDDTNIFTASIDENGKIESQSNPHIKKITKKSVGVTLVSTNMINPSCVCNTETEISE